MSILEHHKAIADQVQVILRRVGVPSQNNDLVGRARGTLILTGWEGPEGRFAVTVELVHSDAGKRLVFDSANGLCEGGPWEQELGAWHAEVLPYPEIKKPW